MALPVSFYSKTLADHTLKANGEPETTTMRVAVTTMTAANAAAQEALATALSVAIAGLTLGVARSTEITYAKTIGTPGPSSNPLAQRENKWLVRYHDATTNQKMQVTLGTADLFLLPGNTEFLDLADTEPAAFVDAFEAYVKSIYDATHAVAVDSIQFVGRNT